MEFLDRHLEMRRLDGMVRRGGGFAVVYGRRRIGKTRLLVEWVARHGGVYTVADQSAVDVQRRYFAEAVGSRLPSFGEVEYRDWRALLSRLARDAAAARWRGPLVFDEFPYLVQAAPDLPAIVQRWLDHEARDLVVVVAGSSQGMMQGLVLDHTAPLYGRAHEVLDVRPLDPRWIARALALDRPRDIVGAYAAWGGVPRYLELAAGLRGSTERRIDHLVLDPLGPLHREPDRLIAEEIPSAAEVRPLLDAIGGGAHRVSEIGGRLGRPATSLGRPLRRLQGMGLVGREVPFGEDERSTKRSLYRISDPFTRLWFRVVAPHRAQLATATPDGRLALLRGMWPQLVGEAWEGLCRARLPQLDASTWLGSLGPWGPASRWWQGSEPEWDVVARSLDGRRLLLGEARFRGGTSRRDLVRLAERPAPPLARVDDRVEVVRVLFVPEGGARRPGRSDAARVVGAADLLGIGLDEG